jgi:hypothetical protein
MKKPGAKKAAMSSAPVFPQAMHVVRPAAGATDAKGKKRDNIFSQSRDVREDRGTREMKTSHNAQSMPHGR